VAAWLGENLEDRDGFVPKTMLCLPIFNGQRDVIGVAQLINKVKHVTSFMPKFDLANEKESITCSCLAVNGKIY
jgi:hypothetical protein